MAIVDNYYDVVHEYAFSEGITTGTRIAGVAFLFALGVFLVTLFFKMSKYDRCIVIFSNLAIKMCLLAIVGILYSFDLINSVITLALLGLLGIVASIIIEGFIYKCKLAYKKTNSFLLAFIINVLAVIMGSIISNIVHVSIY
jgi:hypothetical protein